MKFVFENVSGPGGPRLVEIENSQGRSVRVEMRPDNQGHQVLHVPDPALDVQEFHEKFGINYPGKPRALTREIMQFRLKFMREEMTEYEDHAMAALIELEDAEREGRPVDNERLTAHLDGMLDALVDLQYVVLGTGHLQGFDMREGHHRVHAANMRKTRPEGMPTSLEDRLKLKITKPPGWEAPDHRDLVRDNAHLPHVPCEDCSSSDFSCTGKCKERQ